MKQEIKRGCTLNDAELLERVHDWVSRLCISGGNEWVLSVPVDFNHDPDYLISELCNRYAAKQEEYASKGMRWVKASERLPEQKVFAKLHGEIGLLHSINKDSVIFDCGGQGWRYDMTDRTVKEFEWLEEYQPPISDSGSYYQPLFDLLYNEHGLTLLESEMKDIVYVVEKMQTPDVDLMRSIIDKILNIDKPTYSEAELLIIKDSIDRHMSKENVE